MKKIKTFLLGILLVTVLSCATIQFNCKVPEGIEYTCYSDEECSEYIKGYSSIVTQRFHMQDQHGWYPEEKVQTVYINLWADHLNMQLLGKIEAERREDKRIYVRVWTESYDIECNLLDKGYDEGYRK